MLSARELFASITKRSAGLAPVIAAVALGCTSTSTVERKSEVASPSVPDLVLAQPTAQISDSEPADPPSPYSVFLGRPDIDAALAVGRDRFLERCMSEGGFEYETSSAEILASDIKSQLARFEGPLVGSAPTMQDAKTYGYGYSDRNAQQSEVDDESMARLAAVPGASAAVEACTQQMNAIPEISEYESIRWKFLLGYDEVFGRSATTAPVRDAELAWAACMSAAGYPFSTIAAAQEKAGEAAVLGSKDDEIRIAVADVSCRDAVGYVDALSDVSSKLTAEWLSENQPLLEALDESRTAVANWAAQG